MDNCNGCFELLKYISLLEEHCAERGIAVDAWQLAKRGNNSRAHLGTIHHTSQPPLHTSNRFDPLNISSTVHFPSLGSSSSSIPTYHPPTATTLIPPFRSYASASASPTPSASTSSTSSARSHTSHLPKPPPPPPCDPKPTPHPPSNFVLPPGNATATTLVIGSSIVRDVHLLRDSSTICYPGARVHSVSRVLPAALERHPNLRRIVFHVGSNDVMERDFKPLTIKYLSLFSSVPPHIKITVSGPLPVHGERPAQREKKRRLRVVHWWLRDLCLRRNYGFVDNFDQFEAKSYLFRWDGLHLRSGGARLLSRSIGASLGITNPLHPHPPHSHPSLTFPKPHPHSSA